VSMRVTCEYACHMVSRSDLDYITGVTMDYPTKDNMDMLIGINKERSRRSTPIPNRRRGLPPPHII